MTDRGSFLRSIAENPSDDAPRLVFADWLEENGEPERAEFIRVQIALEQMQADSPAVIELLKRQNYLLKGRTKKWLSDLPKLRGVTWGEFRRGFVDSVTFRTAFRVRQHVPIIVRSIPLRAVHFRPSLHARELGALSRLSGLADLVELHLDHQSLSTPDIEPLLTSPVLGKLRKLRLSFNHIDDAGARRIAACDRFLELKILDLTGNGIHGDGALALARSPFLTRLDRLILDANPIEEAERANLVSSYGKWISAAIPGQTESKR
jgi:uncharacterized protein (TIGR02996 family)